MSNPTIQRFFAFHYLVPFIIAAAVVMHLMALHLHGSSNPLGITGNLDRLPMHGYFMFKDLVTVFVFLIFFSLFVFYSPNTLGQNMALLIITILWFPDQPTGGMGTIIFYVIIIMYCAIC